MVELNNIEDRIVRLTPNSSDLGSAIITKDGETLYYPSAFEGGYDLWKMNLRKKDTKLLHKMDAGWANMEMDKDGKNLITKMPATDANGYKQEQKRFYNLNMHGIDWDAMTKAYRKFLPHIDNNYDFAELLSEYLGELNVSHTGGRFRPQLKGDATATLGLLYDWNHNGKGLLISEVVEKGPFDHARSKVKAGNIIEKIDGQEITPESDY